MSRRTRREEESWAELRGNTSPWHTGEIQTGELLRMEPPVDATSAVPDLPDVAPTRRARRRGATRPRAGRPAPRARSDAVGAFHPVESTVDPWQSLLDDDGHWDWT